MKRAHIDAVFNFDLCDPQKGGKSKTRISCHVSLLGLPTKKILR
jgi:hypothetical protein